MRFAYPKSVCYLSLHMQHAWYNAKKDTALDTAGSFVTVNCSSTAGTFLRVINSKCSWQVTEMVGLVDAMMSPKSA